MAKHRTHSVDFKRQVSQEYLGGETLHALSKRHDVSRNLIRAWVEKYQAGALDEDVAAADLLQTYEARIAALERLVGKQALELEFLKGAVHASCCSAASPWGRVYICWQPQWSPSARSCRPSGSCRSIPGCTRQRASPSTRSRAVPARTAPAETTSAGESDESPAPRYRQQARSC